MNKINQPYSRRSGYLVSVVKLDRKRIDIRRRVVVTFLSLQGLRILRWIWDENKDHSNRRKHGLGFATAQLVFDDPLALNRVEPHGEEERWQTVGRIGSVVVFVVHTWPEAMEGVETGRIISARKATTHERRAYEEGDF